MTDNKKHHLSTDDYYFTYRPDKHNPEAIRAELYYKDTLIDTVTVKNKDYGIDMGTHQVINMFEAKITLNHYKT